MDSKDVQSNSSDGWGWYVSLSEHSASKSRSKSKSKSRSKSSNSISSSIMSANNVTPNPCFSSGASWRRKHEQLKAPDGLQVQLSVRSTTNNIIEEGEKESEGEHDRVEERLNTESRQERLYSADIASGQGKAIQLDLPIEDIISEDFVVAEQKEVVNEKETVNEKEEAVNEKEEGAAKKETRRKNEKNTKKDITQDVMARMERLKRLHEKGLISDQELKEGRDKLIDNITGTSTVHTKRKNRQSRKTHNPNGVKKERKKHGNHELQASPRVIEHPPPDFLNISEEMAIKHIFSFKRKEWSHEYVRVKLDEVPFAKGGIRIAYHLQIVDETSSVRHSERRSRQLQGTCGDASTAEDLPESYVAKLHIDPGEDIETYFRDVEMQAYCAYYARRFNIECNPPKKVHFIKVFVLELIERVGSPLFCVERYMSGSYRKHNNNFGYVSEDERNTPQAFSHFTYEASGHTILVCDIQGVDDMYTDPQMHTISGIEFGPGNMGKRGIEKFLANHRCNPICNYLALPPINPKDVPLEDPAAGTVPAHSTSSVVHVAVVNTDIKHYYIDNDSLKRHLEQRELMYRHEEYEPEYAQDNLCCDGFSCCVL